MRRPAIAGLLAMALVLAACGAPGGSIRPTGSGELLVFGAASLGDVLDAMQAAWNDANPAAPMVVATDSSAALRAQIEQGAPAHAYLAADVRNPAALASAGLAAGEPVVFAANGLTIVVPADNPAGIRRPADLARPGLRIVAAGDGVPITGYAAEAVERLGIAEAYAANVVSREDNVRAVLAKIELGEGDAAVVYRTDARSSDRIREIALPDAADVHAAYAAVVVAGTGNEATARRFLDWVVGPEGQAILASAGFLPPDR